MPDTVEQAAQLTSDEGSAARVLGDGAVKARFFAGLIAVVILTIFGALAGIGLLIGLLPGWHGVAITSGSLRPGIVEGDLVLVNDAPALIREGQVVTYADPITGDLITHRIVAINADGTVTTKGDANVVNDPVSVPPEAILGAGRFVVPFIGLPALWISTGQALELLGVVIIGTALIYLAHFALSSEHDPWADPP